MLNHCLNLLKIMPDTRKYIFLLLFMIPAICFGQDRIIELEIVGSKAYNNLYLRSHQFGYKSVRFAGETVGGSQWTFTVPDYILVDLSGDGQKIKLDNKKDVQSFYKMLVY